MSMQESSSLHTLISKVLFSLLQDFPLICRNQKFSLAGTLNLNSTGKQQQNWEFQSVLVLVNTLECLLGLVERKKRVVFCYLRDRIWKEKISIGEGSIYQRLARRFSSNLWSKAIPSYFMSVSFLLPSTLQDDLQKIMNSFWWGSNKNTDKDINWLSWDLLSIKKENEGMGFQHLYAFNLAML